MKQIVLLSFLLLLSNHVIGQTTRKLVKDLDGDSKKDTVYIDSDSKQLICSLSTNAYKKNKSEVIRILNFGNTLVATATGFEFWNNYDRSEYCNEFQYNSLAKKMQLLKMTRNESDSDSKIINGEVYRTATTGKSTINLKTNQYLGEFKFHENYTYGKDTIGEALPIIKAEMIFPQTYIETFSDAINYDYEKKCVALLEEVLKERINKN